MSKSATMAPSAMARAEGAVGSAGCSGKVRARLLRVRGRAKRMAAPAALRRSWGVSFHPSGPGTPAGDPGFHPSGPGTPAGDPGSPALPRPMIRRRWAFRPVGAGRRKVSQRVALNSPEESQGVAAARRAGLVVRRVGVAGASLVVAVSAAKTTRSGVAKSAGDWWSRVVVTGLW